MKGFLKIPYEWVQKSGQGLTATEALVLADIQYWKTQSTLAERSERLGLSIEGLRKALSKLQEKGFEIPQSRKYISTKLKNNFNNVENKTNKVENKHQQSGNPPYNPPIIIEDNKEYKELGLTIVSPAETSSAPPKKSAQRKEKKYTPEESKLHGELKAIFDEEWVSAFGDSFYWDGAEMAGLVKIKKQIQFKMKSNECDPNDAEQIKFNFRFFIHKILTSLDNWTKENSSPKMIAGRFNVIYNQLKNGKSSSNTADNFHVFGSRNITPDILAEFT